MLENKRHWKLEEIPPNPLREDFFVYFLEEKGQTDIFGRIFRQNKKTIIALPIPPNGDFMMMIGNLLYSNSHSLETYYLTMREKEVINEISSSIIELQDSIQSTIKTKSNLNYFDLFKHYKQSKHLEKLISQHFSLILNYTNRLSKLRSHIDLLNDSLANGIFQKLKESLIADLQPNEIDIETFSKCIDYAREMSEKSYTIKVTILGALLGIVGGVIGSLVLQVILDIFS